MPQPSPLDSWGSAWKYAQTLMSCSNRRTRSGLQHDANESTPAPAPALRSEGDLFGIRALEAGYTGGIAQSKPQITQEETPLSPGLSQLSYVMDSPPRRPPHARRAASPGSKSQLSFKLQPAPRKRDESPNPPRPSTANGSRSGTPTMWFRSQQDASVPKSWYLPTSEEIFGNGPVIPTSRPSTRTELRSRASIKSTKSDHTSDSSSSRGRERLQPSDAELNGRINHAVPANTIAPTIDDSTTQQSTSATTAATSVEESRTSRPSTPRSAAPGLSLFPKVDGYRRPTTPRTPKSFQFDLESAVEKRSVKEQSPSKPTPSSTLRPLSFQNESFSHTPPQPQPQQHDSENTQQTDDRTPRRRVESQIIDSYIYSNMRRTSSPNGHMTCHSRDDSTESATSHYSDNTVRDIPRAPSTAPCLETLSIASLSPFDPFFPLELTPPLSPDDDEDDTTIKGSSAPNRLSVHANRPPSPDHLSPRHRQSLSASTFSSFNTSASLHDRSYSPDPALEPVTYASAKQARFSKEAPRLSIIRRSMTASPTSPRSPVTKMSHLSSLTPTREDDGPDGHVWRTNSMKIITVSE
ncbi:hypothetical protein EJ05DRAFT_534661 [Pseudovirgaria hyperparasitica]|uniref:Uncharacterized protein n=1 Tax=Pseudovirgaria hyperparasitica TaxID=470096 RepID=A0A6A6WM60_9PEZI|nr:uncharacterized protein EJ05DRAFT_534661 [Pseudovirgaria hyperparasitica]KAF2763291.1 hypothetical protein EJ05DRAFT_534661 [Pseudovirgaria hyperparasitica]